MEVSNKRLFYIDNIRWVIIILVVLVHCAVTYSQIGSWYYTEAGSLDTLTSILFILFQGYCQSFFMGLLFFIAGYFVPQAFDRRGRNSFIIDRLKRLGLPALLYMLIIHPVIIYLIMWKAVYGNSYVNLPGELFKYYTSFKFIGESGPLWFALALLLFSSVFYLINLVVKRDDLSHKNGKIPGVFFFIVLIVLMGITKFTVRLVPFMRIGEDILNMQLCFFSQYIILFVLGIFAYRLNSFERIRYKFGVMWLIIGFAASFIVFFVIMIAGNAVHDLTPFNGGFTWQSLALSLWEELSCISISLGLIVIFREKYNSQRSFGTFMSTNAFCVYVFHAPVVVGLSLLLRDYMLHPLIKFVLLSVVSLIFTFLLSNFILRRVPFLKEILK